MPLTLEAIESLANKGVTPAAAGGRKEFYKLVYSELTSRHAKALATDSDFRHVRVMAFLLEPFSNRCPKLALEYRQRGELYLAGLLDELADH